MEPRILRLLPAAVALTAALGGVAGAGPSGGTVASARNGILGPILVSAAGRTLYHTSAERRGVVACTGACAVRWPPLLVAGRAGTVAGAGVTAAWLGTIERAGGRLQVTYRGLPLYLFSGDTRAGQVNGQGSGGTWHAVAPSGAIVTKPVPSTPATSSSGDMGSSGSMTGTGPSPGVNVGMWCAANPSQCVNGVPIGH